MKIYHKEDFVDVKLNIDTVNMKVYHNDDTYNLGDLLYLCLQVYKDRRSNVVSTILNGGVQAELIQLFPQLSDFFSDIIGGSYESNHITRYQKFELDYDVELLESFIREYLLSVLFDEDSSPETKSNYIYVNKPNYPEHLKQFYEFDISDYLVESINLLDQKESIFVMTDDIFWFKEIMPKEYHHLFTYVSHTLNGEVLKKLKKAQTLMVTNDSTGYWLAYILKLINESVRIIVPNFHSYLIDEGAPIAQTKGWELQEVVTQRNSAKEVELSLEKTVGILYIGTGAYESFFDEFYETAQQFFLPNHKKTFYVFTDSDRINTLYGNNKDVVFIYTEYQPWPHAVMKRYHFLESAIDKWKDNDLIYFFNGNTVFKEVVDKGIVPREDRLLGLLGFKQAGYITRVYADLPYENNSHSQAYIPFKPSKRYIYVQGGFFAGKTDVCIMFVKKIKMQMEKDIRKGITAIWHDESHVNALVNNEEIPIDFIDPTLLLPEEYGVKSPIILRQKKRIGGKIVARMNFTERVLFSILAMIKGIVKKLKFIKK